MSSGGLLPGASHVPPFAAGHADDSNASSGPGSGSASSGSSGPRGPGAAGRIPGDFPGPGQVGRIGSSDVSSDQTRDGSDGCDGSQDSQDVTRSSSLGSAQGPESLDVRSLVFTRGPTPKQGPGSLDVTMELDPELDAADRVRLGSPIDFDDGEFDALNWDDLFDDKLDEPIPVPGAA